MVELVVFGSVVLLGLVFMKAGAAIADHGIVGCVAGGMLFIFGLGFAYYGIQLLLATGALPFLS